MTTRPAQPPDHPPLIPLIAAFRAELAALRRRDRQPLDLAAAAAELAEYTGPGFALFVAEDRPAALCGYLVCRIVGDIVWAEQLYVVPGHRRRGIASALYAEAERLAQERGGDFPYNWVDPENHPIIRLLAKRGYTVLNLVELRRPYPGEQLHGEIAVGDHRFRR